MAVDGARAVGVGTSTYRTDATRQIVRTVYHNVYLLEWDGDGRCRSFTEIYAERTKGR